MSSSGAFYISSGAPLSRRVTGGYKLRHVALCPSIMISVLIHELLSSEFQIRVYLKHIFGATDF